MTTFHIILKEINAEIGVGGCLLFNTKMCNFSVMQSREHVTLQWYDDDVRFVLEQYTYICIASSLKQ